MGFLEGFLWGIIGGVFAELLGLFKLRQQAPESLPQWLKSPFYWLITLGMIVAGGLLVVIYLKSGVAIQVIVAVNLGASAPLIIGSLVAQTPRIDPGRTN